MTTEEELKLQVKKYYEEEQTKVCHSKCIMCGCDIPPVDALFSFMQDGKVKCTPCRNGEFKMLLEGK